MRLKTWFHCMVMTMHLACTTEVRREVQCTCDPGIVDESGCSYGNERSMCRNGKCYVLVDGHYASACP